MVDAQMRRFLEQHVDSLAKLHIVLLFAERSLSCGTASAIAQRTARDIWSVGEALEGLTESGILERANASHDPIYCYNVLTSYESQIRRLQKQYEDPHTRDAIHRFVRDIPQQIWPVTIVGDMWAGQTMGHWS